jgi:hypothetical protein
VQPALQQAPEVLHGVGVDVSVYVFDAVVDDGVFVVLGQTAV